MGPPTSGANERSNAETASAFLLLDQGYLPESAVISEGNQSDFSVEMV
jgi:hypothetical protein